MQRLKICFMIWYAWCIKNLSKSFSLTLNRWMDYWSIVATVVWKPRRVIHSFTFLILSFTISSTFTFFNLKTCYFPITREPQRGPRATRVSGCRPLIEKYWQSCVALFWTEDVSATIELNWIEIKMIICLWSSTNAERNIQAKNMVFPC